MIGTGPSGVPGTADPMVTLAIAALQLQEDGLRAASDRLAQCRAAVPASADDTWQGPARVAYDAGLGQLRRLVAAAEASVDDALTETRRAADQLRWEIG